ncbi:MAG: hypothetical protein Ct9H90mP16_14630 [Candidatus Poseidoniales archaeon]|nr:MAG: hypothetical protein Ct9H90mP16_14630 [Candidatus Poseidoniales archaeon]
MIQVLLESEKRPHIVIIEHNLDVAKCADWI